MKERMTPLREAAERCGVSRRTLKTWIRQEGYNLPERQGKGRYTILVPDSLIEKVIDKRSPRIARVSYKPRPKVPVPEGQQMTGDQTKA
jgi:predicted site-specific integrase-resolvase